MLLKVVILVDVDTTDTDIEDMRTEILNEARTVLADQPNDIEIEPYET